MNQPVSWLEFVVVIAVFLLAQLAFEAWKAYQVWRDGKADVEKPEEPSRFTACTDPACPFRRQQHQHVRIHVGDG